MPKLACSLAFMALSVAHAQWTKVTLYDTLEESCKNDVADKNFGDPAGDAYFQIKDMYLPFACAACKKSLRGCHATTSTFDCDNPESAGKLVVRQVEVEVRLPFGAYNLCNTHGGCRYQCVGIPSIGVGKERVCGGCNGVVTVVHVVYALVLL